MTTTINGRTPDEIKKGLECCSTEAGCPGCPYYKECVVEQDINLVTADALACIQQLERERDAAIADIPRACGYCKFSIDYGPSNAPGCKKPDCMNISGINTGWQWRGVQEEVQHGTE